MSYYSFLVCDHGDIKNVYINGLPIVKINKGEVEEMKSLPPLPKSLKEIFNEIGLIIQKCEILDKKIDYPDETPGSIIAAEARARCNNLTEDESKRLYDKGMDLINKKYL